MGGSGVIDNFLGVFTSYIDSGFGLLGGEVAFIATTLIVIDVTLAALFWSWGADDDIIARLVKKTLFVGVFAYIIGNWNSLARIGNGKIGPSNRIDTKSPAVSLESFHAGPASGPSSLSRRRR